MEYSRRLGSIVPEQFQAALDRFQLGTLVSAEPIPHGLFGQNVKLTSSSGEYVLRGVAHFDWQFPKEQLVASILHSRTPAPAPWPYLLDLDRSIFGWRNGYALMPHLPGLQLADPEVLETLPETVQRQVAFAVGTNLRDMQQAQSPYAGHYDHEQRAFQPLATTFPEWIAAGIRGSLARCVERGDIAPAERDWIEKRLADARDELATPFTPVLVHHDYKHANLTVQPDQAGRWKVSGVFDLMEAFYGDGEMDLVRQLANHIDADQPSLAASFLDGYRQQDPLRPGAAARLAVYLIRDRLIIWDYWHQPDHTDHWWYDESNVRQWLERYLDALARLL